MFKEVVLKCVNYRILLDLSRSFYSAAITLSIIFWTVEFASSLVSDMISEAG